MYAYTVAAQINTMVMVDTNTVGSVIVCIGIKENDPYKLSIKSPLSRTFF